MNLDLVKILKNCPKGTKLYSKCLGIVEFNKVIQNRYIEIVDNSGCFILYRYNGKLKQSTQDAEIDLFPSKNQRDWSKWQRPFVKGDVLVSEMGNIVLCSHIDEEQLVHYHCLLNPYGALKISNDVGVGYSYECTLASDSQKQRLFDSLKKEGYEWNEEIKELKKIEEKFDISTLQPFDKVLVRDDNISMWVNAFYGFYDAAITKKYPFVASAGNWVQCIPYEGNEHLLGTTNDCDEYYKNW